MSSTSNKKTTVEPLDERLNKNINTEAKWVTFRNDVLLPLLRKDINYNENTYGKERTDFPTKIEPIDTNEHEYTIDRPYSRSMNIGGRMHLSYVATMFHNEMLRASMSSSSPSSLSSSETSSSSSSSSFLSIDNNKLKFCTIANQFDRHYSEKTFFSMVRPYVDGPWTDCRKRLWQSGVTFPFTHDITDDLLETVDDPNKLYRWTETKVSNGQQRNKIINDQQQWRKIFSPLTYYNWIIPNSVLNTWTFSIDPNIAHTLNWYRFYLNRIATYKDTVIRYATELQRQHDLNKKRTTATNAFVKRHLQIKRSLQMKSTSGKKNVNYDRFLLALNKLYDDFNKQI